MAIGAGGARGARKCASGVRECATRTVSGAVEVPTAWAYLAVVAVLVPWASMDSYGLFGEPGWIPRFLVVLLCAPWTQLVVVLAGLTGLDALYFETLDHSFWADSPPWLFEPLWLVFCAAAALVNARLLAAVHRGATGLPYRGRWVAPLVAIGFPTAMWICYCL
ncbi:hypothetical protein [Streptomyces sp. ST2-7A]|uniref:SCO4225 family membrane protein n=1 Tax=Streptomyces sp. ST2-7A TaxID=2907214 RepID=UPI001F18ECC5|nr:hypothetical protein [Streptomyces sp. ST2-7A]MCE7080515.1 hypothetical protein [Streptomyces sp. ST2-7A]